MKKLLMTSVALGGLALAATPAHAEIELEVGGYFKGYMAWVDQDEVPASETNDFDIVRDTEIHLGGETTLDNGLTVGAHFEFDVDGGDGTDVDESYLYFSGDWGRVNFGAEDGATYLLQVAAPSADSNYDGIRQYVNPFNSTVGGVDFGLDYDADPTGKSDKLTYLTPVINGFQGGVSFTPDSEGFADDVEGIGTDDVAGEVGHTYEIAARYEGEFNNIGVIFGAGYSLGDLEDELGAEDEDRQVWNVGLDLDIGAFGIGAAYMNDNNSTDDDTDTIVVGVDYTTGPFKIGASYLNEDEEDVQEADRYTGGVNYEYGPGMSFRGSVSYVDVDEDGGDDADGVALLVGTQVNF